MLRPPAIASGSGALQPSIEDLLANRCASYALDKMRHLKSALQAAFRKTEDKRMAPSSASGVNDVLHAVWAPQDSVTSSGFILGALPGGVLCVLNASHMQKSYIFGDEAATTAVSSRSKKHHKDAANNSTPTAVTPTAAITETQVGGTVDAKELERRHNLNTVAVVALPPTSTGPTQPAHAPHQHHNYRNNRHNHQNVAPVSASASGLLVASVVGDSIATFVLHDLNARTHHNLSAASVHKGAVLPQGSWKRISMLFNIGGDRLLAMLRPSGANASTCSTIAVLSRPSGLKEQANFTLRDGDEWQSGPTDVVAATWLDAHRFLLVDKAGVVHQYRCVDSSGKGLAFELVSAVALPIMGMSITTACFCCPAPATAPTVPTPGVGHQPLGAVKAPQSSGPPPSTSSLVLYAVLGGFMLHTFDVSCPPLRSAGAPIKRGRDDEPPKDAHEATCLPLSITPTHAALSPAGLRIQAIAPACMFQQPLVVCTLESGAVVVLHGVHLDLLHHHVYQRRCKDSSGTKLFVVAKDRPMQLCLYEDETVTVVKAS